MNESTEVDGYITITNASRSLGIKRDTLFKAVRNGRCPYKSVAVTRYVIMVPISAINAALKERESGKKCMFSKPRKKKVKTNE